MKNKPTNPQVHLLCRLEPRLARFPHLVVADRWLEIPKQACYIASIAKKNEHINKSALTPCENLLISVNTSILALQFAFFIIKVEREMRQFYC